jgi:hypothetical protein
MKFELFFRTAIILSKMEIFEQKLACMLQNSSFTEHRNFTPTGEFLAEL